MDFVKLETLIDHFEDIGDYEMTEFLLRKLIGLRERFDGKISHHLIPHLYNLALILESQRQRAEALRIAKRAYSIARMNRSYEGVDLHDIRDAILRLTDRKAA